MSDGMHGTALTRRVLDEHRRTMIILAVALVLNVLVYALAVYPLSQRVANIEERDRAAEQALAGARQDHAQATGTVTGRDRAGEELVTFYNTVLPQDLASARRLFFPRVDQLASQSGLFYKRSTVKPEVDRTGKLTQVKIDLELSGTYANMRTFIHQLETAPEFIVIDNIELREDSTDTGTLDVAMELSTYFRTAGR